MDDRYQSTIPATTLGFAFTVLFAFIAKAEPENKPAPKITAEISGRPGGEEGETDTALVRDGKVIAVRRGARLGGRYVTRAGWSGNENIVLEYDPELSGKPLEVVPVE